AQWRGRRPPAAPDHRTTGADSDGRNPETGLQATEGARFPPECSASPARGYDKARRRDHRPSSVATETPPDPGTSSTCGGEGVSSPVGRATRSAAPRT